ncbi:PAS domain-containing protein [Paludibaculum fermentans]|uniref:PAS domain-containing protein n=1 Tax=Paludibaculum fermentans TaxID=1473598 RepID=UPI003EBC5E3B
MTTQEPIALHNPAHQLLLERVSELEEQVGNLLRLEDAVRRNSLLFESLLAGSRDGITLTTADATVIRVVKSILGYAPLALAGTSMLNITHPEDQPAMLASYRQLIEQRAGVVQHELRLMKPDGSHVWVGGTVTDMLDNPNVLAIVHNYRDISHLRRLDAVAMEAAVLIESVPYTVFSQRLDGVIQTWNHRAQELFAYSSQEVLGQHVWLLLPEDQQARAEADCRAVIETISPSQKLRTVHIHKDGCRIPVDVVLRPLLKHGAVHAIARLCYPVTDGSG